MLVLKIVLLQRLICLNHSLIFFFAHLLDCRLELMTSVARARSIRSWKHLLIVSVHHLNFFLVFLLLVRQKLLIFIAANACKAIAISHIKIVDLHVEGQRTRSTASQARVLRYRQRILLRLAVLHVFNDGQAVSVFRVA